MMPAAHLRRIPVLVVTAILSCSLALGSSYALATSTRKPLTRAQKLSRALKACKKQPKRKRAACVRRAKKKYGRHHAVAPSTSPATTPTAPVPSSTAPGTTPAPAPGTTPAGPVAPPGPTLAWLQQQLCASPICDASHQISNLTILTAGPPRLGTGISTTRGGDGVPSDTWIYPLLYSYDESGPQLCYVVSSYCPTLDPILPTYFTETTHWRTRANALLDAAGQWALRPQGASTTCDPDPGACTYLGFGGGA